MKKLLCLIFVFFLSLPVFAEYKIESQKNRDLYKFEISRMTKIESIFIKNHTDIYFEEATNIYNEFLKEKKNKDIYLNNLETCIQQINTEELNYYLKILYITNDYIKIKDKNKILGIDYAPTLGKFIYPYLTNNNVDIREVKNLINYLYENINKIEKYKNFIETY